MLMSRLLPAVLFATCLGCGTSTLDPTNPGDPNDPRNGLPSSYDLQVGSFTLKGNSGVESSWQESRGALYLGADAEAQPLGTVTIRLGPISTGTNGSRRADVVSALVSASQVRVGTAEELGAKLYQLAPVGASEVTGIRTGLDYIEGTFVVDLQQVSPAAENGAPPATATLTGTFRAVNN